MRHLLVLTAALAAAAAVAFPATAGSAERVPMGCQAEWDPIAGWTAIYLFAPDTPQLPIGVSGSHPYTAASGTGTFTPSGAMSVVCSTTGRPQGIPPWSSQWNGTASCSVLRGGADYSGIGARVYQGNGHVLVTPNGKVLITCDGAFTGIYGTS